MPKEKEVAQTGAIFTFVWPLFARSIPLWAQDALFILLIVLAFVTIGVGWSRWKSVSRDAAIVPQRKQLGLLALIAGSLALLAPFAAFFEGFALIRYGYRLPLEINWRLASLALSICGFLCGLASPVRIRFAATMAAFIAGWIMLLIPPL